MIEYALIPINAAMFCLRGRSDIDGDGKSDFKRWMWVAYVAISTLLVTDLVSAACWIYIQLMLGTLPTNGLLSAIHGNPPGRQDWIVRFVNFISPSSGKIFGIECGLVRGICTIPGFIILAIHVDNPFVGLWYLLLAFHGLFYYLWGLVNQTVAARNAELTLGGLIMTGILQ